MPGDEGTPIPVPLPRQWGIGETLAAKHNRAVVKTLVSFMLVMVVLPVGTFFALYDFFLIDAAPKTRTMYSGIAAVLAANGVMAAYAIVALNEGPGDGETESKRAVKVAPLKVD